MDYEYCKRSGQIPAFGNWDYANELPITQYFENARQAGLLRHSSFSGGEADLYDGFSGDADFYGVDDLKKPSPPLPLRKVRAPERRRRAPHVKEQRKLCDVSGPQLKSAAPQRQHRKHMPSQQSDAALRPRDAPARGRAAPPKAVDEDLYKIPPEMLSSSLSKQKQKKVLGFISSCLVPACSG